MTDTASPFRAAIAAAVGIVLMWLFALLFHMGASRDVHHRASAQESVITAAALATVTTAGAGKDAALPDALTDFASRMNTPGAAYRVIDVENRRIAASLGHGSEAGAPRDLRRDEKQLYDLGQSLAQGAIANREEGRDLLPEMLARANETTASAAFPVRRGTDVIGYVEATRPTSSGANWGVFGWLALIGAAIIVAVHVRPLAPPKAGPWIALIGVAGFAWIARSILSNDLAIQTALSQGDIAATIEAARTSALEVLRDRGWPTPDVASLKFDVNAFLAPATAERLTALAAEARALGNSLVAAAALAVAAAAFFAFGGAAALWRTLVTNRTAYIYLAPAIGGMLLLSFLPFFYGVTLSFTDTTLFNQDTPLADRFVGVDNYAAILGDFDFTSGEGANATFDYTNFYWTLGMTVAWTIANVAIGVSMGLALALLLNTKGLRGAGVYRTLLILPWAIPNYITALTWKGIFHPQFGAANQVIQALGGQPVAWFDSVWPSFMTGVITNGWLSFPFMMVVCLGALQSVDEDMYEAAKIDGANAWQRFTNITLPSLAPALIPAIVVSVVWTFNMFNVIYLVSAGQPGGSTEILVTRAYKVAFEEYRYGYAAAYSVVIFLILLFYGWFQTRVTKAAEGAR